MSSQESPKDATKDKAGKPKDIKTDSTKTVVEKAPAREDAEDAKLDDEETAKILDSCVENAEDDARDYEEFLSWKAGERRLRDEERKIKFRAMLKEKEQKDKVQTRLKDEKNKDSDSSFKRIGAKRKIRRCSSIKETFEVRRT